MNIVAEGFGAIAVVLNFIGYRQTNVDKYLLISAFALSALSVQFFYARCHGRRHWNTACQRS